MKINLNSCKFKTEIKEAYRVTAKCDLRYRKIPMTTKVDSVQTLNAKSIV